MQRRELVITADGSHSIYLPDLGEAYHSRFGAISESEHVFIRQGLHSMKECSFPVEILEVGFGTGLNALLCLIHARNLKLKVNYTALEPYRLNACDTDALNYPDQINDYDSAELFRKLHATMQGCKTQIAPGFVFEIMETRLENMHLNTGKFHLVFYDAFSPETQPELWTEEIFLRIHNGMASRGILVTYCCKGTVKRALRNAGFKVFRIPGPPGKREMIRAEKTGLVNQPLTSRQIPE